MQLGRLIVREKNSVNNNNNNIKEMGYTGVFDASTDTTILYGNWNIITNATNNLPSTLVTHKEQQGFMCNSDTFS